MKHLVTFLWLALVSSAFSETKFAAIRITDIYRKLPSTEAANEAIREKRMAILDDVRAERLREVTKELREISERLQKMTEETDQKEREELLKNYRLKATEAESIRQEFETFSSEQDKLLKREIVDAMRASLARITAAAGQIARERNLDVVLDISGKSNTGVPVVVHSGDTEDITEDVFELLDAEDKIAEAETAETEPKESEEPQE